MNQKREDHRQKAIERQIDENLRRVYQQDEEAELPDKFLLLLEQLKRQE